MDWRDHSQRTLVEKGPTLDWQDWVRGPPNAYEGGGALGKAIRASNSRNAGIVGYSDLQGRAALQVTLRGDWCYVGLLPGRAVNPLTSADEPIGTSILDVSDPTHLAFVAHIPAAPNANCRAVQVVTSPHDGHNYMIRNHETETACSFQMFDVTERSKPVHVSSTTGSDPHEPEYVSRHWLPAQHESEPDPGGRAYSLHPQSLTWCTSRCTWGLLERTARGGGYPLRIQAATILRFSIAPTFDRGPHNALPFYGVTCPNFGPGVGDVRDFVVFVNEATDSGPNSTEVRTMLFMLDVTAWHSPMTVDTFRVPDGDFATRGGRFGAHQFAETKDGGMYSLKDNGNILYLAYFNAGLRVLDLSDPDRIEEVGYFVPMTTERTTPRLSRTVIQTNDVDLDHRGWPTPPTAREQPCMSSNLGGLGFHRKSVEVAEGRRSLDASRAPHREEGGY